MSRAPTWFLRGLVFCCSLALSLAAAEWMARLAGQWRETAQQGPDYGDTWAEGERMGPGGYLQPDFRARVIDGRGGTVLWHNNSQGFRNESEFSRHPPPATLRILSLGDSFAAGYRVGQHQTYSYLLQQWVSKRGGPTQVLLACTESPFNAYLYLSDYGLDWNPHVVLLQITLGNDVLQDYVSLHPEAIGFAHGLETMEFPAHVLRPPDPPPQPSDWALLRLFGQPRQGIASWYPAGARLFDPSSGLGLFLKQPPPSIEVAYQRHFQVLSMLQEMFQQSSVRLVVVLAPQRFQVQRRLDWPPTVARYGLRQEHFDLELPNRRILQECRRLGLLCIDPTETMGEIHRTWGRDLYLPGGDMHWNPAGHRSFLQALKPHLLPLLEEERKRLAPPGRLRPGS
ncbi:MAG TPA: hypothetical protein VLU25_20075 [Acidobacteriota bacterium]|nr:hypothetical protein [Acidobacteriota bacterium]